MVKGDCNNNKAVAPAEGDSIFYEGYLKDGYVHVYNLSKLWIYMIISSLLLIICKLLVSNCYKKE